MNKGQKSLSINETFIIEPENDGTMSACTGFFTNALVSCTGNTQIILGTNIIETNSAFSATTFFGDGSNLTGISTQDTFVTGGTYDQNYGVATFINNTGGTFNVTGFYTGATDVFVTGVTKSNDVATFVNNTGGTFTLTGLTDTIFTGGTISGPTVFTGGLASTTISATTYQNLPLIPTQTSQLTNNGENGTNPFVDNQDNLVIKLEYTWNQLKLDSYTATDQQIEEALQPLIEEYTVNERQHLYITVSDQLPILNIFVFDSTKISINDFESLIGFTLENFTLQQDLDADTTTITFTNTGYTVPEMSFAGNNLISIISYAIEIEESSFEANPLLTSINFPILEMVGNSSFKNCSILTSINLPQVKSYGNTTKSEEIFAGINGNTIQFTTPIIHETSNGGDLEGDLKELSDNNKVTFNWI